MNYNKIYSSLIERAKTRKINSYTESHHILPKCLGGSDEKENLVDLTPEEHYLCHKILCKLHPDNINLVYALNAMNMPVSGRKINNKKFGWSRRKLSEIMKTDFNPMKRFPEKNPFLGKKYSRKLSDIEKKNISERMKTNNPMKNKKPWEHSRATKETIDIWKMADKYYEFWKKTNCSYYILAKEFGFSEYKSCHVNMIKMFRNGWIPKEDNDWCKI